MTYITFRHTGVVVQSNLAVLFDFIVIADGKSTLLKLVNNGSIRYQRMQLILLSS